MEGWEEALAYFCTEAKGHNIDFYLIGSESASVRGVVITPKDIDLIVDVKDIEKVKAVFQNNFIAPIAEKDRGPVRYYGMMEVSGVSIEISARPENVYGSRPIDVICWNGHILKAQTLELLYQVYQRDGKAEYVRAIDAYWSEGPL